MKMEDIAQLAGVSKSAVSLAFSGKPGIGPETRERILQVARENGYLPKAKVSASTEPQTKLLTFLVLANSGIVLEQYYQQPFFRELIHYIEERCRTKGYSLIFSSIDMEFFDRELMALAQERPGGGVVLLGTNLNRGQITDIAGMLGPHLVVLDTCFDTLPVHFVEINNYMGAYQAGAYLCRSGHRNIGYIASNIRIHNFEERQSGFKAALREYELEIMPAQVFSAAPTILSSQRSLKAQLESFLRAGRSLPTAFFCECDYIAISAMKTLTELGYRVPEDASVVGFDNISEAVIVHPELTTVHVEKARLAYHAVDLVIDSIESVQQVKTKMSIDTRLVERHSSRPIA
ncbi:LacI family transcriptional regulator [Paenibacillus sp. H1-7]|uniref:LacI family DNA-binding transcriptional regulator n=1 Tax=Paenibacillus sp. H1-7 TaxID=2282849 RepID=UPI001EF89247|nr:substrate-binding domain-containing protein [Paenibacillus sp. H1-7]ULL17188.1 LacI family transcriptional regulator [Paenibacillus sp. H1-7]